MENTDLLKKIGLILAILIVLAAIILLITFLIGGSNRMLSSDELAQQHTQIALEISNQQTAAALTSTAALYLTLGVPMPTETPFLIPTDGILGKETRTPPSTNIPGATLMPPGIGQPTQTPNPPILQPTITKTIPLLPGQPTYTLTATKQPTTIPTQATGWGGEWTAWVADTADNYQSGVMKLTENGSDISGTVQLPNGVINLSGKITEDGKQVFGNYSSNMGSGLFFWERQGNYSLVIGNRNNKNGFCAVRPGMEKPDPCMMYSVQ